MAKTKERELGRLSDLALDEVSLVDLGANQFANVVLAKRYHQAEDEALTEAEKALRAEQSNDETQRRVEEALNIRFRQYGYNGFSDSRVYIRAMFKSNVVYQIYNRDRPLLFRCEFALDANGVVSLGEEIPVEVIYVDKAPPVVKGESTELEELDFQMQALQFQVACVELS